MKLRRLKRSLLKAMASAVVVDLRVPASVTPFTVMRALQSMTRNRIRGRA